MSVTKKPKILIVYTGGTIGMIENPETKALEPFNFDHLIENVPKIKMLDYEIDNYQFKDPIDSSAMNTGHWADIAAVIGERYDEYDGFVVLHGTDTMAYTASALSFIFENLDKPVIITGSQLPIGEVRTDGEENLITALQVAAATDADGQPMVREVAILFENYLWRGNRSTKRSADNFDAFHSNNYPELARIGLSIYFNKEALWRREPTGPLQTLSNFDENVIVFNLFPGIKESTVKHILSTPGLKGVVMKTYGAGNAPTDQWFLDAVRDATKRGIVIVNITQCPNGSVMPMRYHTGRELSKAGVVAGHNLTTEAAVTKLMYLLGQGYDNEMVRSLMERSLRGELN